MRTKEECTPKRRRNAANRGKPLQDALDDLHATYLIDGRAWVIRTSAPMRITKRLAGGKFQAVFVAEGMPDYFAVVDGVAVVFDAKSHEGHLFPFSAIPEHQARAFGHAARHGATAGIVVRLPDLDGAWWVPWAALGPLWWSWHRTIGRAAASTASLDIDALTAIGVFLDGLDWHAAIVRARMAA